MIHKSFMDVCRSGKILEVAVEKVKAEAKDFYAHEVADLT
jgi:hypothetical protein